MASNGHVEEHQGLPHQAARILLPYLLSSPPYTPANLTSKELNRRRQLLRLSPEKDAGQYLVTDLYSTQDGNDVAATTLNYLRILASQVEEFSFSKGKEASEATIGRVHYRLQDHDAVLIAIELGTPALLALLLRLDGEAESVNSYKYDNLLPIGNIRGSWCNSIKEARMAGKSIDQFVSSSLTAHEGLSQQVSNADLQEAEPSEYITNADEFWAGVESSDDEVEAVGEKVIETVNGKSDEEGYWNSYGNEQDEEERDTGASGKEAGAFNEVQSKHDDAIKMILCGAFKMMKNTYSTMNDSQLEQVFIRLAREAINECK